MDRARSTSPPKSAWPGVSMMLILTPFQMTEQFLAAMVMPALPLQVHGVHEPLVDLLVGPEQAALAEHGVHQGGFAVVDVGR